MSQRDGTASYLGGVQASTDLTCPVTHRMLFRRMWGSSQSCGLREVRFNGEFLTEDDREKVL